MELFFFSIREANLIRSRVRLLLTLRKDFLNGKNHDTIHDLRVASRRTREILDYQQSSLPPKWFVRLSDLARTITKRLGRAREVEVNAALLQKWYEEESLDPAVAEFMIYEQTQKLEAFRTNAIKRISKNDYDRFEGFLAKLRGSRRLLPGDSDVLQRRKDDFLSFVWSGTIDDERLHDLRIRTKKFRYAVEIYDRLHDRNLGHFMNRIKRLQELLGDLHDLYVLEALFRTKKREWEESNLKVIPHTLEKAIQKVIERKTSLYPQVYPLYASILQNAPTTEPLSLLIPPAIQVETEEDKVTVQL